MKKIFKLIILASAFVLTGCFDMSQDMWINPDSSGRVRYQLGINEQLATLSGKPEPTDICAEFYQDKATIEQVEAVQSVTYDSRREGGVQFCILEIRVQHYAAMVQLQTQVMKDSQPSRHQAEFHTSMELGDADNGKGTFRLFVENTARRANKDQLETQAGHFANMLMAQVMSGRYWTVTLHVPKIISANGETIEQGKIVQWRVPLYDLMMDMDYAMDMQAEFELNWPWYKRLWKWVS